MRSQSPPIATFGASLLQGIARSPVGFLRRRAVLLVASVLVLATFLVVGLPRLGGGFRYEGWKLSKHLTAVSLPADAPTAKDVERKLQQKKKKAEAAFAKLLPSGKYIVIDQTHNRIQLRRGDEVLLDAVCSAGSGMLLEGGGHTWVFDTPRGRFKVQQKIQNPVWKKPDWAFWEEGKPPPKDPSERIEPGMLGEYAMPFGNGYMIHGTLYERLLGRSVTHGCIRVGRDDLRFLFSEAAIGTPIYIY